MLLAYKSKVVHERGKENETQTIPYIYLSGWWKMVENDDSEL